MEWTRVESKQPRRRRRWTRDGLASTFLEVLLSPQFSRAGKGHGAGGSKSKGKGKDLSKERGKGKDRPTVKSGTTGAPTAEPAPEKPDARRPAPEEVKAGAAAKAALLERAAQALREAGLVEQAAALEKEGAEQKRLVEAVGPPPDKRLDLLEAFVCRSEGRLLRAKDKEKETEKALSDATAARAAFEKELDEGRAKLQALRAELAASDVDAMEGARRPVVSEEAHEMAWLRAQLAVALRERDDARATAPAQRRAPEAAQTAHEPSAGQPPIPFEELQQRLAAAQEAYQDALKSDRDDEIQSKVRDLAELTGQLIDAKRRRTA